MEQVLKSMKARNTLYIFPNQLSSNKYIEINKSILSEAFNIKGLSLYSIGKYFTNFSEVRSSIAVLNWFEDNGSKSIRHFFVYTVFLMAIKILFGKIVWVRHNFNPHSGSKIYYKIIVFFLSILSDEKVTHRKIEGYKEVPHPLYPVECDTESSERVIEYLCFGKVSRYKGIVELLKVWDPQNSLVLAGSCKDDELLDDINSIISSRGIDVQFINQFICDSELDKLLSKTKTVILPHTSQSMIVSGAFYHAISYGVNVIVRDDDFYSFCSERMKSVYRLESINNRVIYTEKDVRSEAVNHFGDNVVRDSWANLINSLYLK